MPRLETVENCMKISQMITQALEAKSSPLQQLPHIRADMLRHFVTKRVGSRDFCSPVCKTVKSLLCLGTRVYFVVTDLNRHGCLLKKVKIKHMSTDTHLQLVASCFSVMFSVSVTLWFWMRKRDDRCCDPCQTRSIRMSSTCALPYRI